MTPEEMEKAVDFIVGQQAQTTAKLELVGENLDHLTRDVATLAEIASTHSRSLDRIADLLARLVTTQELTEASLTYLTAAQTRTDERLNDFITAVERYISQGEGGRNGGRT